MSNNNIDYSNENVVYTYKNDLGTNFWDIGISSILLNDLRISVQYNV